MALANELGGRFPPKLTKNSEDVMKSLSVWPLGGEYAYEIVVHSEPTAEDVVQNRFAVVTFSIEEHAIGGKVSTEGSQPPALTLFVVLLFTANNYAPMSLLVLECTMARSGARFKHVATASRTSRARYRWGLEAAVADYSALSSGLFLKMMSKTTLRLSSCRKGRINDISHQPVGG